MVRRQNKRKLVEAGLGSSASSSGTGLNSDQIKYGESKLFDWMYERDRWGLMSFVLMGTIAALVIADLEEFKDHC